MHTPGPWVHVGPIGYGELIRAAGGNIAVVYGASSNPAALENAGLIAASPDLYEAVEMALPLLRAAQERRVAAARGRWGRLDSDPAYQQIVTAIVSCEIALKRARVEL